MVNLSHDLHLIMLEEGLLSYDDYLKAVPASIVPSEYKTLTMFLKNRGKASRRIQKESEWYMNGFKRNT